MNKKSDNEKIGYWVYSTLTIIFFVVLFGFVAYLMYDLILKLAEKDFSNNTVVQALITLVITVFVGGYFSKAIEYKYQKKQEVNNIQNQMALRIIDLSSVLFYHPDDSETYQLLFSESSKVKLYFTDEVLLSLNSFIDNYQEEDIDIRKNYYLSLIEVLKKNIK